MTLAATMDDGVPARKKLVDIHDSAIWSQGVHALEIFVSARGTSDVPLRVRAGGIELGQWVHACRTAYWEATLPPVNVRYLAAQPAWDWGMPRAKSWRAGFLAFEGYVVENDTALVPTGTVVDGISLPVWCDHQRARYAVGDMHSTRIELLEGVPGWQWDANTLRWESGLSALRSHLCDNTLGSVRRGLRVAGIDLGAWVQRCRQDYNVGALSSDRIDALEAIEGWQWGRSVDTWAAGLAALEAFVCAHGHSNPVQRARINDFAVGTWVNERRRDYRAGSLESEKVRILDSLPGWEWAPQRIDSWERGLAALTSYAAANGHAHPVRGETHNDFPIGVWVSTQRGKYQTCKLTPERIALLEALPGWRWARARRALVQRVNSERIAP